MDAIGTQRERVHTSYVNCGPKIYNTYALLFIMTYFPKIRPYLSLKAFKYFSKCLTKTDKTHLWLVVVIMQISISMSGTLGNCSIYGHNPLTTVSYLSWALVQLAVWVSADKLHVHHLFTTHAPESIRHLNTPVNTEIHHLIQIIVA